MQGSQLGGRARHAQTREGILISLVHGVLFSPFFEGGWEGREITVGSAKTSRKKEDLNHAVPGKKVEIKTGIHQGRKKGC